ncbi:hypothetical protein MBLNU230_g1926t1 [Neophaeotheca triangularis]
MDSAISTLTTTALTILRPLDFPLTLITFILLIRACDYLTNWTHLGWARDRAMGAAPYCIVAFILEIMLTMLLRRWTDPIMAKVATPLGIGETTLPFLQQWVGTGFTMWHMRAFVEDRRVLGDWGVVVGWRGEWEWSEEE